MFFIDQGHDSTVLNINGIDASYLVLNIQRNKKEIQQFQNITKEYI